MVQYSPASDKIVHEVSVDFKKRMVSNKVHVVQYDNAIPVVAVSLYSDSGIFVMPSSYEANIRVKKPDRTFVYNRALGWNSTRTILYFEITEQMTSLEGLLPAVVELRNGNSVSASGYFEIEVDRNPVQIGDIESTNEFTRLQDYVDAAGASAASAASSASNASQSASNASASASAALTSERNAKASETASAASQRAAATSESNAASSASSASSSASSALASKNAAGTSEANARTSETNAHNSEVAASGSASSAAGSASSASTSATNAATSASAALASQNAAKTSETNAKTSETNASTSAGNAASSASAASTSATNAANSASAALTSEGHAATSATEAAASASRAESAAQMAYDASLVTQSVNELTHHRISQKITDSDGNYITDSSGGYLEFEALFVEPADLVPIFERLNKLESQVAPALATIENLVERLTHLENTAIQGVIL